MMSTIPWPYRSGGAPKTNSPQCILAPFDGKNKFSNITDRGEKEEDRLMLTNPRDAFRGQSRSPNTVLFDILGTVSCQCAVVTLSPRRAVFQIFDFKKRRDLEIRVRSHSRSLKLVPFLILGMVSYYCPIVTLSEIFDFKNAVYLEPHQGSLTVIETATIQQIGYGFLFVFHRNFVPKIHRRRRRRKFICRNEHNIIYYDIETMTFENTATLRITEGH